MANQAGVLHQPLNVLGAHQHDFLRGKPEEGLLKGRPLGVYQAMPKPRPKYPQRDGRQVAIIGNGTQLICGSRLGQQRLQRLRRAKAIQAILVQPAIVLHRQLPLSEVHDVEHTGRRLLIDTQAGKVIQGGISQL